MRDSIVALLAVNETYAETASALSRVLLASGNAVVVVTDQPAVFAGVDVEIVPHMPEAAHIWHAKRHALRAGLERAHTTYYLDADHRSGALPPLPRLAPGAACARAQYCPLGRLRFNWLTDGGEMQAPVLDEAAQHMGVADWRPLPWWGDTIFAVSRDVEGVAWRAFLHAWDRFAAFTVGKTASHPLVLGDGMAMAFAAHLCGWRPYESPQLTQLVGSVLHLARGSWRAR